MNKPQLPRMSLPGGGAPRSGSMMWSSPTSSPLLLHQNPKGPPGSYLKDSDEHGPSATSALNLASSRPCVVVEVSGHSKMNSTLTLTTNHRSSTSSSFSFSFPSSSSPGISIWLSPSSPPWWLPAPLRLLGWSTWRPVARLLPTKQLPPTSSMSSSSASSVKAHRCLSSPPKDDPEWPSLPWHLSPQEFPTAFSSSRFHFLLEEVRRETDLRTRKFLCRRSTYPAWNFPTGQ